MVKFIVVDESPKYVKRIEKVIREVVMDDKEVLVCSKLDTVLKKEIGNLDCKKVYILEIELGSNVSGISIAKLIRKVDYDSEIIFITNHDQMFESAHRNVHKIYDFIEKFHNFDRRLEKDLKEITNKKCDGKVFHFESNQVKRDIYFKNILYIYRETEERKLIIVTPNNKYRVNMTIKEIQDSLDERFVRCHRSCIYNKTRVEEKNYKEGYFTLDTGEKVYMLSKKYKDVFVGE